MTTADAPWDTEWAAQKAAEALRYLGRNFPECLENLRVASLDEHETDADEAAIRGDEDAYRKALKAYMRAGRRDRERRDRRRAREAAERRHEELREVWRRRHADGEEGRKGRSERERWA